jgi:hypothetical protein
MAGATSGPVSDGTLHAQSVVAAGSAWHGCPYYNLCIYSEKNFTGAHLFLYQCGFTDLGQRNFPGGGKWNDKMSSFINNQTYPTDSLFYNWDGRTRFVPYFTAGAFSYKDELVSIGSNDVIDGIHVC